MQENALIIINTLFQTTIREDSTHGHHQVVNTKIILITFFAAEDGAALFSQQKQDWELTVAQIMNSDHIGKFRLELKKVGKTTRSFRYDLNQIPYDYTLDVTNRFKGLDLIDGVPEELWMEVPDIVQEAVIKNHPQETEMQKGKLVA